MPSYQRVSAPLRKQVLPQPDASIPLVRDLLGRSSVDGKIDMSYTRASSANGVWNGQFTTVGSDIPRFEAHSDQLGILMEESRTNSILYSRDFSNAAWTKASGITASADATGIDGKPNTGYTIDDDGVSAFPSMNQIVSVLNDSNTHCVTLFLRRDADTTRFPEIQLKLSGGTQVDGAFQVNTATGASTVRSGTFTSTKIDLVGDYWQVVLTLTNNSTGNTAFRIDVFPAVTTTWGTTESNTSGSIVLGGVQAELDASGATSFIDTTNSPVSRAADFVSGPTAGILLTNNMSGVLTVNQTVTATSLVVYLSTFDTDANNFFTIVNNGTNFFVRKYIAGPQYNATFVGSATAGNQYKIGWRISSTTGMDIWVNGVKGSNLSNTSDVTISPTVYYGVQKTLGLNANANIKDIRVFHTELSDTQMAQLTS